MSYVYFSFVFHIVDRFQVCIIYFNCILMNVFKQPQIWLFCNCYINLFSCILGKSFLLKTIANCALDRGLDVSLSAPTGKLSSTYAHQLPICRCNTVHSNFFIPVDNTTHPSTINWGLSDVHVLLVDEVINSKTMFHFFYQRRFTIVTKSDYFIIITLSSLLPICNLKFLCFISNWFLFLLLTQLHKQILSNI